MSQDVYPESWRPQPGDAIKGKVVDLDARVSEYGQYPLVTLEEPDGRQLSIHAFHDVLKNELARRSPKIGDELEVSYFGKHPQKDYHVYRVTGNGSLAFSWEQFGGPPQNEPQNASPDPGAPFDPDGERDDDIPF